MALLACSGQVRCHPSSANDSRSGKEDTRSRVTAVLIASQFPQMSTRSQYPHPLAWAAFTLIGEAE